MKNVISTCLYGGDNRYFKGAIYNAKLTKKYFPEWEFRVYHQSGINLDCLNELNDLGANTIDVGYTNIIGSLWRFLVYDDKDVNYFICRDLDDRLNMYDAALVNDWLNSGYPFHIIRSHRGHTDEMLAGLWGGRANYISDFNMKDEMSKFSYETNDKYEDQKFLRLIFYPKIRDVSIVYGYDYQNSPVVRKFPIEFYDQDGYISYPVGEVYEQGDEESKFN